MKKLIISILSILVVFLISSPVFPTDVIVSPTYSGGGFIVVPEIVPSDVPQAQANALVAFYNATDGDNWDNNTGWKTDPVVNNWTGVTVSGGNVTQLNKSSDSGLSGAGLSYLSTLPSLSLLYLSNTSVSGDVGGLSALTSLTLLRLNSTSVSGNISGLSALTSLSQLYADSTSVSGNISGLSELTSLTQLLLNNTSVSGDLSGISALTSLSILYVNDTSVSGNISGLSTLTLLTQLYVNSTSVSGDLSGLSSLTSLITLLGQSTSLSGSIGGLSSNTALLAVYLYSSSVSYTSTSLPAWTNATFRVYDLGLTEAQVDDFLDDMDTAGGTGGNINISGSNAPPSAAGLTSKTNLEAKGWTVTVST